MLGYKVRRRVGVLEMRNIWLKSKVPFAYTICNAFKRCCFCPKMKTHFKTSKSSCCHLAKYKTTSPVLTFLQLFCGSKSVRQRAMWAAPAQKQAVPLSLTAVAHCVSSEEFPELLLNRVSEPAGSQGTSPGGLWIVTRKEKQRTKANESQATLTPFWVF